MFESTPYVGAITVFAGTFAPVGWLPCDGRLVSIAEYDVLFNLIGTTYGGDGINTFALPDLQSRVALHQGTLAGGGTFVIGEMSGTETITITTQQMPAHAHQPGAVTGAPPASNVAGNLNTPTGNVPALAPQNLYNASADGFGMSPAVVGSGTTGAAGNSQPTDIISPYLTMKYIISMFGIYPTQS
ncbi:MAG: phage tail protein [Pseudobacter sp.]|uniref:phage tail protein n=1 Tax=Pseudobacter sp. TaxID=2045420 RepID=UPI003F823FC6